MKKIRFLAIFACLAMALAPPAGALEYTIDTPEGTNYGKPTSIEVPQTADGGARKNEDISKNAAKIPPLFGSEASNTLNTGSYLTPNLIPGMQPSGGMISSSNAAGCSSAVCNRVDGQFRFDWGRHDLQRNYFVRQQFDNDRLKFHYQYTVEHVQRFH